MKKYKEFLIDSYSWSSEERAWDGHRSEGTGRFDTGTNWKIIDPKTAKEISGFDSEKQAEAFIDNHLGPEGRMRTRQIQTKLKNLAAQAAKAQERFKTLSEEHRKLAATLPRGWS